MYFCSMDPRGLNHNTNCPQGSAASSNYDDNLSVAPLFLTRPSSLTLSIRGGRDMEIENLSTPTADPTSDFSHFRDRQSPNPLSNHDFASQIAQETTLFLNRPSPLKLSIRGNRDFEAGSLSNAAPELVSNYSYLWERRSQDFLFRHSFVSQTTEEGLPTLTTLQGKENRESLRAYLVPEDITRAQSQNSFRYHAHPTAFSERPRLIRRDASPTEELPLSNYFSQSAPDGVPIPTTGFTASDAPISRQPEQPRLQPQSALARPSIDGSPRSTTVAEPYDLFFRRSPLDLPPPQIPVRTVDRRQSSSSIESAGQTRDAPSFLHFNRVSQLKPNHINPCDGVVLNQHTNVNCIRRLRKAKMRGNGEVVTASLRKRLEGGVQRYIGEVAANGDLPKLLKSVYGATDNCCGQERRETCICIECCLNSRPVTASKPRPGEKRVHWAPLPERSLPSRCRRNSTTFASGTCNRSTSLSGHHTSPESTTATRGTEPPAADRERFTKTPAPEEQYKIQSEEPLQLVLRLHPSASSSPNRLIQGPVTTQHAGATMNDYSATFNGDDVADTPSSYAACDVCATCGHCAACGIYVGYDERNCIEDGQTRCIPPGMSKETYLNLYKQIANAELQRARRAAFECVQQVAEMRRKMNFMELKAYLKTLKAGSMAKTHEDEEDSAEPGKENKEELSDVELTHDAQLLEGTNNEYVMVNESPMIPIQEVGEGMQFEHIENISAEVQAEAENTDGDAGHEEAWSDVGEEQEDEEDNYDSFDVQDEFELL